MTPTRDPTPDGCRECALPGRGHYRRWTRSVGWHGWIEPSDAQRLARMKARRARRLAPKTPAVVPDACYITLAVHDPAPALLAQIADQLQEAAR